MSSCERLVPEILRWYGSLVWQHVPQLGGKRAVLEAKLKLRYHSFRAETH